VSSRIDVREDARRFARDVHDLLNKTVCNGAMVSAGVVSRKPPVVVVGTNLEPDTWVARPVPLTIDAKNPTCFLEAQYRCGLDDRGQFLMVISSFFAIYAPDELTMLCHYDYERAKEGYPAAHVQIRGQCEALEALPGPRAAEELEKLHFPVGGRRYRPTIEDMVEFVVTEGFARARPKWRQVVDEHREQFQEIQLRAAIRRRPDVAVDVLRDMKVSPPLGEVASPRRSRR
jgi:hypothetical protein